MLIEITPTVRIRYEAMNFVLEKKVVVGESSGKGAKPKAENIGTARWDNVGYYGDLRAAAHSLLNRHFALLVTDNGNVVIQDLKSLINAVDFGAELITQAIKLSVPAKDASG